MCIESREKRKKSRDNKVKRKKRAQIIKDLMYHAEELKFNRELVNRKQELDD